MNEIQQLIDLTEKGLTQVATQLGTTLPQLWEIMVRQQYIEAIQAFILLGVSSIVFYFSVRAVFRAIKDEENGKTANEARDSIIIGSVVISGVFLIISFAMSYEGIGQILNPEYYAIQSIVEQIGTLTNK